MQDTVYSQALPCRFNAVYEDGGRTGDDGLKRLAARYGAGWEDALIGGRVFGGFDGLCMVFDQARSMLTLPATWEP